MTKTRSLVEWVDIGNVIPNSLNPRKNDAIDTSALQKIIDANGWEEPLTAYKSGPNYVLLAGHRRLFAAKKMNTKQVPVYVVERPASKQEELARISSLQRAQVDWSPYDWASSTYDSWVMWGKPAIKEFSQKQNIPETTIKEYISVIENFSRGEIETKLDNKTYKMKELVYLVRWMKHFNKQKPVLFKSLGSDMIKKAMLKKIEYGKANTKSMGVTSIFKESTDKDVQEFLTTYDYSLDSLLDKYSLREEKVESSHHGVLISVGRLNTKLKAYNPIVNEEKYDEYIETLEELAKDVKAKATSLRRAKKRKFEKVGDK